MVKIILFILSPLLLLFTPKYDNIFTKGYQDALTFIEKNGNMFNAILEEENHEKKAIISIVFPELMKHSFLIDYFQERAMQMIYIRHGKEKADFSIGHFQMKPSFVEKIEQYITQSKNLKDEFAFIVNYSGNNPYHIREERIYRMKSLKWQLYYMKGFYAIMLDRFDIEQWNNHSDMIRIFATAYNHDFLADISELKDWSKKNMFPYGDDYDKKQYSYSKISAYFYQKDWENINKILQEKQLSLNYINE